MLLIYLSTLPKYGRKKRQVSEEMTTGPIRGTSGVRGGRRITRAVAVTSAAVLLVAAGLEAAAANKRVEDLTREADAARIASAEAQEAAKEATARAREAEAQKSATEKALKAAGVAAARATTQLKAANAALAGKQIRNEGRWRCWVSCKVLQLAAVAHCLRRESDENCNSGLGEAKIRLFIQRVRGPPYPYTHNQRINYAAMITTHLVPQLHKNFQEVGKITLGSSRRAHVAGEIYQRREPSARAALFFCGWWEYKLD